jgi:NTE family protein
MNFKILSQSFFIIFAIYFSSLELFSQETTPRRPKIGVVLSGGGAKGLAHIGFLKVMEEAGIRPDFIGGTSMGSIIGGLYAIGYSADSLEKIARDMKWAYYLTDEIPRIDIVLDEKADNDKFLLTFPIQKNKISIPSGIVDGQNIENKLNILCSPVFGVQDFNDFQIPFLCIATDIVTGEEVVFREGYLSESIRASMGIPSIFNPIEIEGKLLVDGGVVNNFPVNRVKEMGADIIIGVDVGFQFHKKEDLNSLFKIIEQTSLFLGSELNIINKGLCDILISPDLTGFSASSFNATDTLIARGEIAARAFLGELKSLADSLKMMDPNYGPSQKLPSVDSIFIKQIDIKGLNNVSAKILASKLQLDVLRKYTSEEICRAAERAYSSFYFEKISWKLESLEEGARLNIQVNESEKGIFRAGLHYDSNYKSAILLNTTFRNIFLDNSRLSTSLSLGENPFFNVNYFKSNDWKPGFGVKAEWNNFNVFLYNDLGRKISNLRYTEGNIHVYLKSIIKKNQAFGFGTELERTILKPRIYPGIDFDQSRQTYLNYYGFLEHDSYEKAHFSKHGAQLHSEIKLITSRDLSPVLFFTGRANKAVRLSPKSAIILKAYGGFAQGDSIPYQYYFYTGGLNPLKINGLIPFVGLDFMERANKNALILGADYQLEVFKNFYVTAKFNAGNLTWNFNELFSFDQILGGYGITLSYDSWIGPIEYTWMKSTNRPGMLSFINLGYWF